MRGTSKISSADKTGAIGRGQNHARIGWVDVKQAPNLKVWSKLTLLVRPAKPLSTLIIAKICVHIILSSSLTSKLFFNQLPTARKSSP